MRTEYKTHLPHTFENQAVLKQMGDKITQRFGRQFKKEKRSNYFWLAIGSLFPSAQTMGTRVGENLAMTYGSHWSNSTIEFIAHRCLKVGNPPPVVSFWSLEGIKQSMFGASHQTAAEALKMTITPQALPYIKFISGAMGALSLPAMLYLASSIYQNAIYDPYKLEQLSKFSLNELFSIDKETRRLRDGFGRLFSLEDMQDVFVETAKYDFVCKLIDTCHAVDQIEGNDDQKEEKADEMFNTLVQSYVFQRSDGKLMFYDGTFCGEKETQVILDGIKDLSRVNPLRKEEKIIALVELLSSRSVAPFATLSSENDLEEVGQPKSIPAIFSDADKWKNGIIRTEDGKFMLVKDGNGMTKGTLLENGDMVPILNKMEAIQQQKKGLPLLPIAN